MYISKKEFPDKDEYDFKAVKIIHKHKFISMKSNSQFSLTKGQYFISVYGVSYCSYQLFVMPKRSNMGN